MHYHRTATQAVGRMARGQWTEADRTQAPPPGTPRDRIEFMILDPPTKF